MMNHPLRTLLILAAAALTLSGCGRRPSSLADFDREVYTPAHAGGFRIVGTEGGRSTLLVTLTPWQGADGTATSLLITRNGEPVPDGFSGQVLRDSARRIICMSSSHVALIDALDRTESVVGVSGMEFIANPRIAARRGTIGDIGYDGNFNYELLVSLEPDLVLLYGVNGASSTESKLRELGIPFVYIGEYLEESPLGKAEWIVVIAELLGRRSAGETFFARLVPRYEALRERAATATSPRPRVMLNTPYGDSWFMASTGSYIARLIADAGGDYVYTKNTSNRSLPVDLEEAYLLASAADVWIHASGLATLADLKTKFPKFAEVPCVRHGQVYNCDLRSTPGGGNDFWESGVVHPDLALRDLLKIFHPETVEEPFHFYRRIE